MAGPALALPAAMETRLPGPLRWWGVAAGIVFAAADTMSLAWLGASFEMGGRDVTALVFAWFALSFAFLGFLVGYLAEVRGRERAANAELDAARVRVAQSEKLAAL